VTALSCVLVPISPHQQLHLALISEFNVKMLYLPGLKTLLLIFCLAPPPPPLWSPQKQSMPRRRLTQWISRLWPPSKTAAQKRSACSVVHPSNWPFAKQALNPLLVMFQQAFFAPWSQRNSEKTYFSIFTIFHVLGGLPPGVWCLPGLSGEGSTTNITTWLRACLHCQ
jgi:hypothetical protein